MLSSLIVGQQVQAQTQVKTSITVTKVVGITYDKYPETRKGSTVDTFFGKEVVDPYRWLEDDMSEDTKDWVKKQNELTNNYLGQIPFRDNIKKRLTELWN